MSSLTYDEPFLQQLSADELLRIIVEQGWSMPANTLLKPELIRYIITAQAGKIRNGDTAFSAGMVTGPSLDLAEQLLIFYKTRNDLASQLVSLSDAALFVLVERLGREIELSPPYARIGKQQFRDKIDMVWYLLTTVS